MYVSFGFSASEKFGKILGSLSSSNFRHFGKVLGKNRSAYRPESIPFTLPYIPSKHLSYCEKTRVNLSAISSLMFKIRKMKKKNVCRGGLISKGGKMIVQKRRKMLSKSHILLGHLYVYFSFLKPCWFIQSQQLVLPISKSMSSFLCQPETI